MTEDAGAGQCWGADGPPLPEAFHVEDVVDPFDGRVVVGMVRHAGHPYRVALPPRAKTRSDEDWQRIGAAYLDELRRVLGDRIRPGTWLHDDVRAALQPGRARPQAGFGWLNVTWDRAVRDDDPQRKGWLPEDCNPLGSFWYRPADAGDTEVTAGSTLVLLAGNVYRRWMVGSDLGLRIAMHVDADGLRIHGVTFAGLASDRALRAAPPLALLQRAQSRLRKAIAIALRASAQRVAIRSLENRLPRLGEGPLPEGLLTASGFVMKGRRKPAPPSAQAQYEPQDAHDAQAVAETRLRVHEFQLDLMQQTDGLRVVTVRRNAFVGSGMLAKEGEEGLNVFVRDPASDARLAPARLRQAAAEPDAVNRFRRPVKLPMAAGGLLRCAEDPLLFETRGARPGSEDQAATVTLSQAVVTTQATVPLPGVGTGYRRLVDLSGPLPETVPDRPPMMSDEQASVECHARATELFRRFKGFGIDPHAYFRFARLPLVQRARPSMLWAPDGELPNAEVRPFIGDSLADGGDREPSPEDRMQLLVKYGSSSPMHRRKVPLVLPEGEAEAGPARTRAQYLSVASDARWAWHEFGHVLNFASTGELEFPFAHSAGDALGAINGDPLSRLADRNEDELRFVTYPWIEVPGRSHGRSPLQGWCWCGRRNVVRLDFSGPLERYQHSYFGEQLMSSSLFRLYRSLGGDTRGEQADEAVRLEAADYCTYLLMRAISLIGPDTVAPARTPDQFVSALIDADLGTGAWKVRAEWPLDLEVPYREMERRGGRVHKVIRWAFERQGLYAGVGPTGCHEGPGMPPRVDVYLADRRPGDGPDAGPGGYAPVPLRWSDDGTAPWQAAPGVVGLDEGARRLELRLGNRGQDPARDVRVRAWWGVPYSGSIRWLLAAQADLASITDPVHLELAEPRPADAHWVLVAADAAADPSNLHGIASPPATQAEVLELVAHDNNLALARA